MRLEVVRRAFDTRYPIGDPPPEPVGVSRQAAARALGYVELVPARLHGIEGRLPQQKRTVAVSYFPEHTEGVVHYLVRAIFLLTQKEQDTVTLLQHWESRNDHALAVGANAAGLPDQDAIGSDLTLQHLLDCEEVVRGQAAVCRREARDADFPEDDDRRPVHHALVRRHDVDERTCRRRLNR